MIKKRIIRLLKRLPIIKTYEKDIAFLKRINRNADKHMAKLYRENSDLKNEKQGLEAGIEILEKKASSVEKHAAELEDENKSVKKNLDNLRFDLELMSENEKRKKTEILTLNRNLSDKHDELRSIEKKYALLMEKNNKLEQRINKAKKDFALFDKFKMYAIRDFSELKSEHDELKMKYGETVKTLKERVVDLINLARTYKYEANDFAMNMLTSTLEGAGISALLFDEEKIEYVTSYVSDKLDVPDERLVGCEFADIFECESLDSFCEFGPKHPLKIKESGREFAGILFNFTMGHDPETKRLKNYRAIWLIDDRKIGISGYFKGNTVAMPRQITAVAAKKAVGSYLNASIGTFGKKKTITLECNASTGIEKEAAEYLAKVGKSDTCKLYIRHPSAFVYNTLMDAGFPEDKIKAYSPEKKSKVKTLVFGLGFNPA